MLSDSPTNDKIRATTILQIGAAKKPGRPETNHITVGISNTNINPPRT